MTAQEMWLLKVLFGTGSGLFAVLAALFSLLEALKNEDHAPVRAWFRSRWQAIQGSRWTHLPENVISFLLEKERKLAQIAIDLVERRLSNKWYLYVLPLLAVTPTWILWDHWAALVALIASLPLVFFFTGFRWLDKLPSISYPAFWLYLAFFLTYSALIWAFLSTTFDLFPAALLMLVILPLYWFLFLGPAIVIIGVLMTSDTLDAAMRFVARNAPAFALAFAASFTVTYAAFFLGCAGVRDAHVPQTMQMLLCNVLFDGCTMIFTLLILRWAIRSRGLWRVPTAVLLDALVAGALACGSLYFGVVWTEHALQLDEVVNVLIGRNPEGTHVELGPYFWAMHTTFLPTLAYLSLIMVCWFGKALLHPIAWFFGAGQSHKNPLKLTAALFALLAVTFAVLAYGSGVIEERLKQELRPLEIPNNVMQEK